MTRALVIAAITLAAVGVVALVMALIGGTGIESLTVNGHTTTTTHHHFGSFAPTILAFALAAIAGFAALLSHVLPS
jgi:hypothetical protein